MDFHLSKEHLLVRKMYREFAENEVKPLAEELDEEERFPMETVEKMAKLGMMGIYFPKQYGGAGGDVLSYAMCVEELAKVCGTTAVVVSAHTSLCCAPIFENGTEEQKMKYLPDLLSGRKIGAFGLTEPGAGTDAHYAKDHCRAHQHSRKFPCCFHFVASSYFFRAASVAPFTAKIIRLKFLTLNYAEH